MDAVLIGDGALAAQCGMLWLDRGHRIAAVVTRAPQLRDWAESRGLTVLPPGEGLDERLGDALADLSVDWVLSIANLARVPPGVLARARQGGVNFHDGPLPDRAGLNAPVWALLEGATRHAITWHLMTDRIDAGPLLVTQSFPIAAGDTAHTLNARCFAAGVDTFPEVIAALAAGGHPRHPQVGTRRVFRRADRPPAGGMLDLSQPAGAVARMVRALDHGAHRNPLAVAKIMLDGRLLAVGTATVLPDGAAGAAEPGRVLRWNESGLVLACGSGAVCLAGLRAMDGATVGPDALATDRVLTWPMAGAAARLAPVLAAVARAEPGFCARLSAPERVVLGGPSRGGVADWRAVPVVAAGADAARLARAVLRALGQAVGDLALALDEVAPGLVLPWVPLRVSASGPDAAVLPDLTRDLAAARAAGGIAADLALREPGLGPLLPPDIALSEGGWPLAGSVVTLVPDRGTGAMLWHDANRLSSDGAAELALRIGRCLGHAAEAGGAAQDGVADGLGKAPPSPPPALPIVGPAQDIDGDLTIPSAILARAASHPDAVALIAGDRRLTYAALADAAARIAHRLRAMGVGRGALVGLACGRGADMVAGALGIQMAGGAYVPMDPAYPPDRLQFYARDSDVAVIVTERAFETTLAPALPEGAVLLLLDDDPRRDTAADGARAGLMDGPPDGPQSGDAAYVIYTSGSTGRPKGVVVTHRNVINLFAGMDAVLGREAGVWLAVTSISFDISVLELFWTLARGFTVVIAPDAARLSPSGGAGAAARGMDFGLYYWGNEDGTGPGKYDLLLEGAKFADRHGFCAVWTPERHFHAFGGAYPNPSVTGAAVAAVTRNIAVRAGSCVAPLHHPARIAEEWAVIDNLTGGRAGLALASGWQPDDFILRPENTPPANQTALRDCVATLRRLWRGEAVAFPRRDGPPLAVVTQPRPLSRDLPIWLTTAGNPETWREAGRIGAHVLTHLLGQSVAELGEKVRLYRAALRGAGHDPGAFRVTVMLHSFLADDRARARDIARGPMTAYLRSAAGLIRHYAWAFPAFRKPPGMTDPAQIDLDQLTTAEMDGILDHAFQRYFDEQGLFGTVEDAVAQVERIKAVDVDEIACLIDFGIPADTVLQGLPRLAEVLTRSNAGVAVDGSLAGLIRAHGVTHLQCTPSLARMLAGDAGARAALAGLRRLLVGGEPLPGRLAADLSGLIGGPVLNMYGPTETTVWSSVAETTGGEGVVDIGRPIVNTAFYVLDDAGTLLPDGRAGELWIGGEGVAAGYFRRDDLTAERFRPDPFAGRGRMYRTGDLVRRRPDGRLDFLGRADHQVKLRGHRIETAEVEAALESVPGIRQAVVLLREDGPEDARLVAYVTHDAAGAAAPEEAALKAHLAARLPAVMVPVHVVVLAALPLTPNGKLDRKALPAPRPPDAAGRAGPRDGVEATIAAVWSRLLGVPGIGRSDNFFALGGHSLLAVQAHRDLVAELGTDALSITDIFRFPVLSALAGHVAGQGAGRVGAQGVPPAVGSAPPDDAMARRRALRAARDRLQG